MNIEHEQRQPSKWPLEEGNPIHIGQLIEQALKEQGMTKAEFGRRILTSRQNVNSLLLKEHIDTRQLLQISRTLGKNLFEAYYQALGGSVQTVPQLDRASLVKDVLELGQLHGQLMAKLMGLGEQLG